MKQSLIYVFCVCILFSCTNDNSSNGGDEFGRVHSVNIATFKEQQDFINQLSVAIVAVKDNKAYNVNTKELLQLLDSAKVTNDSRINLLNNIKQVDNDIKFKDKSLYYAMLFDTAFNKEFKTAINILASNKENKFELIKQQVYPTILKIKEAEEAFKKADNDMQLKYNIKVE